MDQPTRTKQASASGYVSSMIEVTAWIGVGLIYIAAAWGLVGLMIWLTRKGPWGWLATAVVAVISLMGLAAAAFSCLWYLTLTPYSMSDLVHHMRRHPGPATVAVIAFLIIVSVVVVAGLAWLRWDSIWRWLPMGILSSMLVSNGFANAVIEGENPTRW